MAGYVLIVESDPELQRRIADALREGRYELASEAEAKWAERSVAVRAPDALVIDTKLSDGDGFALAEALRRDPDTREAPIVFVASAHRGAAHRAEARRRFAPAEYLSTPLDANSLLAALLRALPPEGAPRAAPAEAVPPMPSAPRDELPDVGSLVAALDGVLRDPEQQRERRSVERTAKSLAGEKAEMQGTLKRVPFARLLRRLYGSKATGALLLLRDAAKHDKKDGTKKIITFVDGYPTSVKSNVLAECLGQILVDRKMISERALADSLARMKFEKRQQGQILVEMGALSPHSLQRALVEQVETKLLEVFAWPDGKFMFKEGESSGEAVGARRLERPPAALILEGIRRHYDEKRQRAVLDGYAGQAVALSPDPVLRLQDVTIDPAELDFIDSIDGTENVDELLARAPVGRAEAQLLLVALAESGMITHAEGPSARRRGTPAVAGAVMSPPAGVVAAVAPAQMSGALSSGQLVMIAETVRTQDFFWSLGLERDATAADIEHAYDAQARQFHPDRYRHSSDEDRRLAQEIFERLGEAHRVLRDPARRRTYVARLDRGVVTTPDTMERAGEITTGVDLTGAPAPAPAPTLASNAAARALYEAGREHLRARRPHEAVEAFRQAARLVPNEAEFRASLGWALYREAPADARAGRAALAELRRAAQLDPRNRRAVEYLAQIFAQTGQPELAIAELERLLALDPSATEAADELRRLRSGT